MTLGPYRVSSPDTDRKCHVFPTETAASTVDAPCGEASALDHTVLVSRYEFVEIDLQDGLCKRCLRSLGHIDEYSETIARRIC